MIKISETEIKTVLAKLRISVKSLSRVKTLANTVFKVSADKSFYLKLYENTAGARSGYKLAHLYPRLIDKGVPVPQVVKFEERPGISGFPYWILSEIEGDMLQNVFIEMSKKDLVKFYRELGASVAKIHSLTFDKFGESFDGITVTGYSEIGGKGPFKLWKDMHKEIIRQRLSVFEGTPFNDLIKPTQDWFAKHEFLIDCPITPRLLHIDLNQKNIFVKNKKLSGIIDFDDAFVGHNEEELMRLESANFYDNEDFKQAFYGAYTSRIALDPGYEDRRVFYYFSRLLVHMDCVIKFGLNYVGDIEQETKILREEVMKILKGEKIKFDKNKQNT